jgi:mannosyl-3-phosphoglycerate phosphatase family protein
MRLGQRDINLVIYTDLDGSLLDHDTYEHSPADALLTELEAANIPVVLVSSKTRDEITQLRLELANRHPFIVENGAAVYIPRGYFQTEPPQTEVLGDFWVRAFCEPREHWLRLIDQLPAVLKGQFSGFSQISVQAIAELTGLSLPAARRAASRQFGEPVHWQGDADTRSEFVRYLEQQGAKVLTGGRFMHVSGDSDKGRALDWLHQCYTADQSRGLHSVAIGDSQNDIAMLEVADYALVIRSPAHPPPELSRGHGVMLSNSPGPSGWSQVVRDLLYQLKIDGTFIHG